MEELNPEHYKYMPHSPGEEKPDQPAESVEQEEIVEVTEPVVIVEEKVIMEKSPAPEPESDSEPDWVEAVSNNGLISIIYNLLGPLFIPTIATLFIFFFSILALVAPGAVLPYSLTVFGATCMVPGILFFILQKTKFIRSFRLYDRSERLIPYVIEFLALGAMAIFFVYKGAAPWIWTVFCGGAAIALVNFLINFKIRISNHCSAIAALLAVLIVIQTYGMPQVSLFWWVAGTALFTGVIGSLAMIRGRHTLFEVLAGYATGFLGIILFSLIH